MAFIPGILAALASAAAVAGTVTSISAAESARKKAKGQVEQAERVRAEERKRMAVTPAKPTVSAVKELPTVERAEALPEKAKAEAAAIAAGRKRKRRTLVTGPRGLLTEPTVVRPTLLGA